MKYDAAEILQKIKESGIQISGCLPEEDEIEKFANAIARFYPDSDFAKWWGECNEEN